MRNIFLPIIFIISTIYPSYSNDTRENFDCADNIIFTQAFLQGTSVALSWTNPAAVCFDEVIIVAKQGSFSATPFTADPGTIVANSDFTNATSTVFDGGKVIYKGPGTSVTVTNLTLGATYEFKAFSRHEAEYSTGVNLSRTVYAAPTSPVFSSICPNELTLSWTNPAQVGTILVFMKEGAAITSGDETQNTNDYDVGDTYELDNDATLVFKGAGNTTTLSSLTQGTTYHFLIINALGFSYSTGLVASQTTSAELSEISFSNAYSQGNQIQLNWTNPDCFDNIIIFAKEDVDFSDGDILLDPDDITANPDFTNATSTTFDGGKAIYKGGGTTITVTGLTPGKTYFFKAYNQKENGYTDGVKISRILYQAVADAAIANVCPTSFDISWTNPGLVGEIFVFRKTGSAITTGNFTTDATAYVLGSSLEFDVNATLVYKGTDSSLPQTGLSTNTQYHYLILNASGFSYSPPITLSQTTPTGPGNVTGTTLLAERTSATLFSMRLDWTNPGACFEEILVVAKATDFTAAIPTGDGTAYTADPSFTGAGTTFDGGKVVYKGTGNNVTVTNLTQGTRYRFKLFTRVGTTWSAGVVVSDQTAPLFNLAGASPEHNEIDVAVDGTIILPFNEAMRGGSTSGNDNSGDRFRIRRVSNGNTDFVVAANAASVRFVGNNIEIDYTGLNAGTEYYITVSNGMFTDLSGNAYAGISNNTTWRFTTATPAAVTASLDMCVGSGYQTLGIIQINETNNNSFSAGTNLTYILTAPNGFEFEPGVGTLTAGGIINANTNITFSDISIGKSNILITYSIVGTNARDGFALSGLRVRPTGGATTGDLTRTGGTGVMASSPIGTVLGTFTSIVNTLTFSGPASICQQEGASYTATGAFTSYTFFINQVEVQTGAGNMYIVAPGALNNGDIVRVIGNSATCSSEKSIQVTVSPAATPDLQTINSSTIVCTDDDLIFRASPQGAFNYTFVIYSSADVQLRTYPNGATREIALRGTVDPIGSPYIRNGEKVSVRVTLVNGGCESESSQIPTTVNQRPEVAFPDDFKSEFRNDEPPYKLSAVITPMGGQGVFTGTAVYSADGEYFFAPSNVPLNVTSVLITYTHTGPSGCTTVISRNVSVVPTSSIITGLLPNYCVNSGLSDKLRVANGVLTDTQTLSRLRFYKYNPSTGTFYADEGGRNNPLTEGFDIDGRYWVLDLAVAADQSNDGPGGFYIDIFVTEGGGPEYLHRFQFANNFALGREPLITGFRELELVCAGSNGREVDISIDNPTYTIQQFLFDPSTPVASNSAISATANQWSIKGPEIDFPDSEISRELIVRVNYLDANQCTGTTTNRITAVRQFGVPIAENRSYCQNTPGPFTLSASGEGKTFLWYDNSQLTGLPVQGEVFDSGLDGTSATDRTYFVTQSNLGCESVPKTVNLNIRPGPSAVFPAPPTCEGVETLFEAPGDGSEGYIYEWKFGDGGTSSQKDTVYVYTSPNVYTVLLKVTAPASETEPACIAESSAFLTVGQNPTINVFNFQKVCENDMTEFEANTDIAVEKYGWYFGDGDTLQLGNSNDPVVPHPDNRTQGTYKAPRHQFLEAQTYLVQVLAVTNIGCKDSLIREVTILPKLTYSTNNFYVMDESLPGGLWSKEDFAGNSTWEYYTPGELPTLEKAVIVDDGNPMWITNISGSHLPNDQSYINSPCFDISGYERPVISLETFTNAQLGSDGAVLQYSINGGVTWDVLGSLNAGQATGINWYNRQSISGGPGGQVLFGWSDELQTEWFESKHSLDPIPDKSNVRFRVAFASNGDTEYDGFAFRKVSIRERNRTILLENFTNSTATNHGTNQSSFVAFNSASEGSDLVKLQYNLNFPGEDPVNLLNNQEPSSRASFYGVSTTSASSMVPGIFIDGDYKNNFTVSNAAIVDNFSLRGLAASPVTINTIPVLDGNSSTLNLKVEITQLAEFDILNAVVHVAIVANDFLSTNHVVRKLLPSPSGIKLSSISPILVDGNNTYTLNYMDDLTWLKAIDNLANFRLIVFVQDALTKEVHQAYLDNSIEFPVREVITGIPGLNSETWISVYPNPANQKAIVRMERLGSSPRQLELFDMHGRQVRQAEMSQGETQVEFDTRDLSPGLYMLQVMERGQLIARKRLVVVH